MQPQPSPARVALTDAVLSLNRIRDIPSARRMLLDLLLKTTPAGRVGVFIDNAFFECDRSNRIERTAEPGEVVGRVLTDGQPLFSDDPAILCVPLDLEDDGHRLGVLYAEAFNAGGFQQGDFLMLRGISRVAAETLDRLLQTAALQTEVARLQRELGLRHKLLGESRLMLELKAEIVRVAP